MPRWHVRTCPPGNGSLPGTSELHTPASGTGRQPHCCCCCFCCHRSSLSLASRSLLVRFSFSSCFCCFSADRATCKSVDTIAMSHHLLTLEAQATNNTHNTHPFTPTHTHITLTLSPTHTTSNDGQAPLEPQGTVACLRPSNCCCPPLIRCIVSLTHLFGCAYVWVFLSFFSFCLLPCKQMATKQLERAAKKCESAAKAEKSKIKKVCFCAHAHEERERERARLCVRVCEAHAPANSCMRSPMVVFWFCPLGPFLFCAYFFFGGGVARTLPRG